MTNSNLTSNVITVIIPKEVLPHEYGWLVTSWLGKELKMFRALRRLILHLYGNIFPPAPPPPPPPLDGVVATVFVREPNGSKTALEHYLEQELIARGATIVLADQRAGFDLTKSGEWKPLSLEAHFTLVGTLLIENWKLRVKVYLESEDKFRVRETDWQARFGRWLTRLGPDYPRPVLAERQYEMKDVPAIRYRLCYRVIGPTGIIFSSGAEEEVVRRDASHEGCLRDIAWGAIQSLDQTNVWSKVQII